MKIKAIRILPPLAFARFGSASEPQANYTLDIDKDDPLGFRRIIPADTLIVRKKDGTITVRPAADPSRLKPAGLNKIFRDGDRIRPVAPFFELFAVTDDDKLVPLTLDLHKKHQLGPIEWRVCVANHKVFRRTGDEKDKVKADTGLFSDHARKPLRGECKYFAPDAAINFGFVQIIKPNRRKLCSQFRLRFTPGPGKIYGPVRDPSVSDNVLGAAIPIYQGGRWTKFDGKNAGEKITEKSEETWPRQTLPSSLFANKDALPPWLNHDRALSRGYLDDACDGFIFVTMKGPNNETFEAMARVCSGPPDFVPDSRFVRTLSDDLDQVVNGPTAAGLDVEEARARSLDIVRRAYETVRFMNVAVMNGNDVDGRPAEEFDTMPAEVAFTTERPVSPVMPPPSVDTAAILALHQQVFAALSAGAAPWFSRLLRQPGKMGDLTDRGRRKMPALMSGADSFYLALTHRQIATIEIAAEASMFDADRSAKEAVLSPRNLTAQLSYKAAGNPVNSRLEMAIANCCPGLEVDFRAIWRRLFEGIELGEHENYVVSGTAIDADGNIVDLRGRRLLRIAGEPVIATLTGPSLANPGGAVTVRSDSNPHGVWTMEWSNCLAHVVDALRAKGTREVECEFTAEAAKYPQPIGVKSIKMRLQVREFFEPDTAVISEALAGPGELTQGLCSPWQNDLRECSCYYWASSRPDFVNTSVGNDGLSHGDNWFAKTRTGEYVPDDYADSRLIGYEDLFKNWEQLQFQIGGKDSAPDLLQPPATPRPRKS